MKKIFFLLFSAAFLFACEKNSISPQVNIFGPPKPEPVKEYYPEKIKLLFVSGDTLFKDTLILTLQSAPQIMNEPYSTASYSLPFPVWYNYQVSFAKKLSDYLWPICFGNPNQTKSVTYKLLN
ncbi:MAG: hypothetical protein KA163_08865 [Bacteroidia bacterium]|nr:hypothetical protein [Bacteroidia bacterium]